MSEKRLRGRVVVVTGGGRGLGREYALLAASEGAQVVVNDLGGGPHGEPGSEDPALEVASAIAAQGGAAVADHHDITDWEGARALIQTALDAFGELDVLINNAGILRDRMLVNMAQEEWDDVIRVHLRGHFCTTRHAAAYWRERHKKGIHKDAVVINTTSISGLQGNVGQVNYATAKSGLATFTLLCHMELNKNYGVRTYAIAPGARTRLTLASPGSAPIVSEPVPENAFDFWDPANVAPCVIWLTTESCSAPSGTVLGVEGDTIHLYEPWRIAKTIRAGKRWSMADLDRQMPELLALAMTSADQAGKS